MKLLYEVGSGFVCSLKWLECYLGKFLKNCEQLSSTIQAFHLEIQTASTAILRMGLTVNGSNESSSVPV